MSTVAKHTTEPPSSSADREAQVVGPRLVAYGIGLDDAAKARLADVAIDVSDNVGSADVVVASTRATASQQQQFTELARQHAVRAIVLAHTGAERLAADLVRAGAEAVVGEGNEEALRGILADSRAPTALLTSFEQRFGIERRVMGERTDQTTGLPDRGAFDRRIGSLADVHDLPTIGFAKIVSDRWSAGSPDIAVTIQKRRLAISLAHVARACKCELFATGPDEFAFVTDIDAVTHELMCDRFVAVAETFHEDGAALRLVVGYARPDPGTTVDETVELARRAVEVAAADSSRSVLSSQDLARGVSVTTELEALVRLLDDIEPGLAEGRGHGERVGRMVAELARHHGIPAASLSRLQLAGHLHDVGRASLPLGLTEHDRLTSEERAQLEAYPERSATMLQLTGGAFVADVVRAHCERWDGAGFPNQLVADAIPEGARLLAVAHAIDEIVCQVGAAQALVTARLRARASEDLDPAIVATATAHLAAILSARN